MRILIISQYFYPENFRINDLVPWLVKQGHKVTVLTGVPNYPNGKTYPGYSFFRRRHETWNGATVVRVPLITRGKGGGLRLILNYLSFALAASLIGPWRVGRKYDAIFVHEPSPMTVGIPAIMMKKLSKAPIFFWVLDLWPESVAAVGGLKNKTVLGLLERMTRWIYRHCHRILVQSRAFYPSITEKGVSASKLAYFPNWAEDVLKPINVVKPPVPLPAGIGIMYAGNIGAAQDFPAILAAAEILKNESGIHWILLGDGREASWVGEEVKKRGLEKTVHLLGSYPPQAMPDFFANADAMLVSLKAEPIFALTIPAKVQAYLACGRPVLAMLDGEGARIVEQSGAGFACSAGDAEALAANVLHFAQITRDDREAMGKNGRQYYLDNFEREKLFLQLEDWLGDI